MRVLTDPRTLAKFTLFIALSIAVLSVRVFGSLDLAYNFHSYFAYYLVLGAFSAWVWFGWRLFKGSTQPTFRFIRQHYLAFIFAAIACVIIQVHEPHVLRVLHDESTHALGALTMHLEKKALLPGRAHYVAGAFVMADYYASFRQYLFQLLVSLLHDFTGYRVSNVYILNAILSYVCLIAIFVSGTLVCGSLAGYVSLGLIATLPLLGQNVNSGGYDVLNLTLVIILIGVSVVYIKNKDPVQEQELLNLGTATSILLSMSRYESILYLLPWTLVVLSAWKGRVRLSFSWFAAISPLLLLPNIISHLILFNSRIVTNAPKLQPGHSYFELSYLKTHLPEALVYFFSVDRQGTNSLLLSIAALPGSLFLLVSIAKNFAKTPSQVRVLGLFVLWAGAVYVLMLTQYWSSPLDELASRFTLPTQLVGALAAGWLIQELKWLRNREKLCVCIFIFWAIAYSIPTASKSFATNTMITSQSEEWMLTEAGRFDRQTTLFVSISNVHFLANRYASISIDRLEAEPWRSVQALKAGLYKDIILYMPSELNPSTGSWKPKQQFDDRLIIEPVAEKQVTPLFRAQLFRFKGYRDARGQVIDVASEDPAVHIRTDIKDVNKAESYRLSLYP